MNPQAEEFRKFIETQVLGIIQQLAEKGNTPQEQIQKLAQLTIDLIKPGMTLEELFQNAVKLDDRHSELAPVVYQVMKEYEKKYEQKAVAQVSQLVKMGRYDDAASVVKKVLQFKFAN
ncbi:hypothetical protein HY214_03145 [Candidatus Roizmanbacteria bacterium]|nr:hypothetical protein [Candidatus Roizmanbacteria bacterium]